MRSGTPGAWARPFHSISICLSKRIGEPVGSLLVEDTALIGEARRVRKRFGGGMRQAGFMAAAGLYALDHHIERLMQDHQRAKKLEATLAQLPFVRSVLPVVTNIVVFTLHEDRPVAALLDALKREHVLAVQFGPGMVRMVTHLDIDDAAIDRVIAALQNIPA